MSKIQELIDKINDWSNNRVGSYPNIREQLDLLWHDIDNGKLDKSGDFYKSIKKVKDDNPKPEDLQNLQDELKGLIEEEMNA
jgi:hypothetical protein|tara:strand:+ start:438 stop:683 length:246 start_codon:yes stop_codon:yes gene_type:complete